MEPERLWVKGFVSVILLPAATKKWFITYNTLTPWTCHLFG